jgi:hypothetical protein
MIPSDRLGSMRLSKLIGAPVRDPDGVGLGHVVDVRLLPARRSGEPVLRVESVLVDRGHVGSLLGYDRDDQRGPWLVRAVIRRLHRHLEAVAWTDLTGIEMDASDRPVLTVAGRR